MKKVFIAFFLTMLFSCFAQEKLAGGILYGKNWSCMISAPEAWGMDQTSFAKHGIYGLFYENSKTLGGNTPIIYINTTKLNKASDEALQKYIEQDVANYKQNGAIIKKITVKNLIDKNIPCYSFEIPNNPELCAYRRFKDCCFLIILAAHDSKDITDNIKNFEYVINSMEFMDVKKK